MYIPILAAFLSFPAKGPVEVDADTLRNFDMEEAVVVASPKETSHLRQQPLSVSLFDAEKLEARGVKSLKQLSALAPGLHMPEYGSRLTSAIYIRGIGSRINTPAVGLYVDNVPYIDKSAYDFTFADVERIDVLRGPQGTLYGRNTMGGLVRVFTANPITHYGSSVSVGATTRNGGRSVKASTFLHPADRMGIALSGFYEGKDGFLRNSATGDKADGGNAAGMRARWSWQPTDVVKFDLTASYEYSDEYACPYFYGGSETIEDDAAQVGVISQNRQSRYRRKLFNLGLGVEHSLKNMVLTSTTAFQHLGDRLFMDNDFTALDIFTLTQRQRMQTVQEEIALKSLPGRRWQWTTGAFALYQHLRTDCPVVFYGDGVDYLNVQLAAAMQKSPAKVNFNGSELPFDARLKTPTVNAALFHQSTFNDLFGLNGLSATLGLRLDYDYRELRLVSPDAEIPYHFSLSMGPAKIEKELAASPAFSGNLYNDSWQLLPKGALQYAFPGQRGSVYFSVAKGYRSGGYNIQAYSDLSQQQLRRSMMTGVKEFSIATINKLPLPEAVKENAIKGMSTVLDPLTPAEADVRSLYYKPEYSWNYEVGTHLNFLDKALQVDLAAFLMKTRDQQLARFAESGLGRVMVNAGRSRSLGAEASFRASLIDDRLSLSAAYGYTHATFRAYDLGTNAEGQVVDYTGNRVPFVPEHTFSASADFRQPLREDGFLRAFSLGADVQGAGSIEWDEANSFSQDVYAQVGARMGLEFAGNVSLSLYGRNLTASQYATFSFESMGRRFSQLATPRHFGAEVKVKF